MSNIENRSRFTISVKHRANLYREFRFNNKAELKQYAAELRAQGFKPIAGQLEDAFLVRIREKGHPTFQQTFSSFAEAETALHRIQAERKNGLFADYTKSHRITFEDLLKRYMKEEGPRKKGWHKVEKYKFQGWLADLNAGVAVPIRDGANSAPSKARNANVMRKPTTSIEWMRKPFASIQTEDIESYVAERLEEVAPATIDREIDVLRSVFTVATKIWKFRLSENPMDAVRRPKYFNERDRRLKPQEEAALVASAQEEDARRSIGLRLEELVAHERIAAASLNTVYARKSHMKEALNTARSQAELDYTHIPLFETFIQFQVMTAARRGEALALKWSDVDFDARSAYLAETKNGRPRSLALRARLVEMLKDLPKAADQVFGLSEDALRKAWARIVARAGIEDLHIHDLRHEAITRVAETTKFSLIDLQKFSGHRDVRMLLRYAHLCTTHMAHKLDEAFAHEDKAATHRGRRRLKAGTGLSVAEVVNAAPTSNVIQLFSKNAA
ncbi:site-specific integrase [Burkholderia sp. LMU1-1-1.1]|uniref:site-specific integrase n=1 Tax=Burkholderia sp. LMU1-1-1.1 TaxID=3135266 RepID=UPI0034493903